jgi:hypothetical protein
MGGSLGPVQFFPNTRKSEAAQNPPQPVDSTDCGCVFAARKYKAPHYSEISTPRKRPKRRLVGVLDSVPEGGVF